MYALRLQHDEKTVAPALQFPVGTLKWVKVTAGQMEHQGECRQHIALEQKVRCPDGLRFALPLISQTMGGPERIAGRYQLRLNTSPGDVELALVPLQTLDLDDVEREEQTDESNNEKNKTTS